MRPALDPSTQKPCPQAVQPVLGTLHGAEPGSAACPDALPARVAPAPGDLLPPVAGVAASGAAGAATAVAAVAGGGGADAGPGAVASRGRDDSSPG